MTSPLHNLISSKTNPLHKSLFLICTVSSEEGKTLRKNNYALCECVHMCLIVRVRVGVHMCVCVGLCMCMSECLSWDITVSGKCSVKKDNMRDRSNVGVDLDLF